jgi:hypothetical protein
MLRGIRAFSLVVFILAHQATTAGAQSNADKHFLKECDKAAKTIARGNSEKKVTESFRTLLACRGEIVSEGLAAALLTYTHESSVQVLQPFMHQLGAWRDAGVLQAAIDLASNTSANETARAFAVRHLLVLAHPNMRYAYSGLVGGDTTYTAPDGMQITTIGNCGEMHASERGDRVGTPLPTDYAMRIRATLAALIASPSTPPNVRNAALCGAR